MSLDNLDFSEIDNIEFDGIDHRDYPDYSDAFVVSADYRGNSMTDAQVGELNDNHRGFVYEALMDHLY